MTGEKKELPPVVYIFDNEVEANPGPNTDKPPNFVQIALVMPLILKLVESQKEINRLCQLGHIHGMPYRGPSWTNELKTLLEAMN